MSEPEDEEPLEGAVPKVIQHQTPRADSLPRSNPRISQVAPTIEPKTAQVDSLETGEGCIDAEEPKVEASDESEHLPSPSPSHPPHPALL